VGHGEIETTAVGGGGKIFGHEAGFGVDCTGIHEANGLGKQGLPPKVPLGGEETLKPEHVQQEEWGGGGGRDKQKKKDGKRRGRPRLPQ